ncbi:MAG: UDP-N-acetylmuramoyl-L-alanine--D-glutamate ligase [Puniceicoccales bacterium]|jgi:UDP-N-acetylmuramoylalanine--D-glutamate ligase|nr:UDP-N-acetylmuramoyl-L-alanine--D-glutamate ligase [Puniceicoccales bacterium]
MLTDIFTEGFKVGIFGCGVSGKAVRKWCVRHGVDHSIFDENGGEIFSNSIAGYFDLIVRSPSFLDDHPWVIMAFKNGVPCIGELDLAANFWKGRIIAVTGTDGKTTTVEFLKHSLCNIGHQAVAVGNIGLPFVSVIDDAINVPNSWAVVEVSSFQAQLLQIMHPDYVLWTNFAPDHVDNHHSLHSYFKSKNKLVEMAKFCDARHVFIGVSVRNYAKNYPEFSQLSNASVCWKYCDIPRDSCLNIPVQWENFALVEKFWQTCNLGLDKLRASAETFRLPKHRLQKICSVEKTDSSSGKFNVEFWNDSKATNFHSFKAAMDSFDRKLILIAGGKSKGEEIGQYIEVFLEKIKTLLLIGETGRTIFDALNGNNFIKMFEYCKFFGDNRSDSLTIMRNAVKFSFSVADAEDVVLLCPGFSSLDMFSGYDQRGCLYEECVEGLKEMNF